MALPDDIPVVLDIDEEYLNQLQRTDYRDHRERVLTWLWKSGKSPQEVEGYSKAVVENTAYRLSKIYRWEWERRGYTSDVGHEVADDYVAYLGTLDHSKENKNQYVKALRRLMLWRHHELGDDEWEPAASYSPGTTEYAPQDYLSLEERRAVHEAALELGSTPSFSNATPEQRRRVNRYLAQRFEKPAEEVTETDWERANSWKVPSLVWTSLDAGLRPVEVERSVVSWVDTDNAVLRIPKEQSSKNRENWIVSIREQTAKTLERWFDERESKPKYDDSDAIWLTKEANPYSSESLSYLMSRLCEEAGIDDTHRDLSWYSIRHSTGTHMVREAGYEAARQQLRHKDERTTMRYDAAPVDERRDALDRL